MVAIMRGIVKDGKVIPESPLPEGEVVEIGLMDEDASRQQWMKQSEKSSIMDIWSQPEEDVYTEEDGTPL
jgi:hypothetical protein